MFRTFTALALALLLAAPVLAQTAADPAAHMADLKAQLAPGKQVFISRQMALTPAEEAEFWPVYDAHQNELSSLVQRRREAAAAYARLASLDEDEASDLAEELAEIDLDEARLNEATYSRLSRLLPAAKALKYLQLERQISTLLRYELAATAPLSN
jgi:Spy/CpxP family protein refolding chaperone